MIVTAERLKILREAANISQSQAGEIVGVQYRTYQKYEYGQAIPPLEKLIEFALYYSTSISYLIGISDKRKVNIRKSATFAQRIHLLREKSNFLQREVAAEIGIHERTYRKYELGEILPMVKTLKMIAAFYGVSVDYLVGLDVAE